MTMMLLTPWAAAEGAAPTFPALAVSGGRPPTPVAEERRAATLGLGLAT